MLSPAGFGQMSLIPTLVNPSCEYVAASEVLAPSGVAVVWRRLEELMQIYKYQGEETCAADGMCQVKCPVKINTGELIKSLREDQVGASDTRASRLAAVRPCAPSLDAVRQSPCSDRGTPGAIATDDHARCSAAASGMESQALVVGGHLPASVLTAHWAMG